jgi:hypothetical protein
MACSHAKCVLYVFYVNPEAVILEKSMKQNVTVSLDHQTLRKAKILAAKRGTSISGLLARQIEDLVGEEDAYERAERQALALLEKGFRLGGVIQASRDELHER